MSQWISLFSASRSARWLRATGLTLVLAAVATHGARAEPAFGLDAVTQLARTSATKPYVAPPNRLPPELRALSYDQQRDIRFRPDQALWRADALPFELMFFHPGRDTQPVRIQQIEGGRVQPLHYDSGDFDFGRNTFDPKVFGDLGFAGFRVHFPVNDPTYKDEVFVALGASYFRAIGAGQHYGLSARGLAIDSAGGAGPEEFPRFTQFWFERPAREAKSLVFYALLESPRATGAYRFDLRPGNETLVEVTSRVFLRESEKPALKTLGLAPLTSMFFFGENQPRGIDFRPEVHDSDGLMIASGSGEWIWRPLSNPARPLVTSFAVERLKGFGLMQRDREYHNFEDTEARYEKRPSAWVEPIGDWGPGRVELMQFGIPNETHDNVVAYWVPATLPPAGEPLEFAYRLHWQGDRQQHPPNGWAVQSRRGLGYTEASAAGLRGQVQYVVDFKGPALDALAADAPVNAVASSDGNARILENLVYRNPVTGAWRMTLRISRSDPARAVELRAFLKNGNDTVSETWSNIIAPE